MTTPSKAEREAFVRFARYCNGLTPTKLREPLDPIVEGAIDDFITTTLTQHNEALLAKLPAKRETRGPMIKAAPWHNTGFNEAIDQAAAIIKRAGITGSGK